MKSNRDVIIRTADLASAKAFYHDALGFPVTIDTEHLVGFDTGAFTLYVEPGDDLPAVFEFDVDDVAAAKERLTAAGCEIVEEDPYLPRCYLRDRYGLVFNINQA
jgi:catechol 2,3-dioxygenase-like lactoylglutathione lyase family enzyme